MSLQQQLELHHSPLKSPSSSLMSSSRPSTMFAVVEAEYHDDFEDTKSSSPPPSSRRSGISGWSLALVGVVLLSVIWVVDIFSSYKSSQRLELVNQKEPLTCKDPVVRREWRTLNDVEKQTYLRSVQCLWDQPSTMGFNHSMYEDFSWVHSHMGNFSHNTPAFVAWHRYFLHIYEQTLQKRCGYTGHLVYWDWSRDWEDMAKSPIWNDHDGFGGNGDINSNKSVGNGHCVTDGPFANRTVHYFGTVFGEHCLSRGFIKGQRLKNLFSVKVYPNAIDKVLNEPSYESFNMALEDGPHNAIPRAIRGDFLRVTAPNDPVFFLHHTQLDRLWWLWQQKDPQQRLLQYGHERNAIDEVFHFKGFAQDRKVSEVMSTETELLCYRY